MFDVEGAFDSVPQDVVLACLNHLDETGGMLKYFQDFLSSGTASFCLGKITGAVRPLLRGLPQVLFNIVMTTMHLCRHKSPHPSGIIIYADDICFWASHSDRRIIRSFTQTCFARVANMLEDLGLAVSAPKTSLLACSRRPFRHRFPRLPFVWDSSTTQCNYQYLGVDRDSRLY